MARNTSVNQYIWGLRHVFSSMICSYSLFLPKQVPTACFTCFSQPVFAQTPGFLPGGAYDTAASNEVIKLMMWGFMAVKMAPKDMPKSCYIARFQILSSCLWSIFVDIHRNWQLQCCVTSLCLVGSRSQKTVHSRWRMGQILHQFRWWIENARLLKHGC